MEKTLNLTPCELLEVLPFLVALTKPKSDTSGGLASVQDLAGGQAFKVQDGGQNVAALTVEVQEFDRGVCLFVTSLAGALPGVDLVRTVDRALTAQAQQMGARQVAMQTKRRGLVRKLKSCGWTVEAIKMVKKI